MRYWSRLKSLLLGFHVTVQTLGGYRATLRKILQIWRDQGWKVLRNGIRKKIGGYKFWLKLHDPCDELRMARLKLSIDYWTSQPLISVVMPVFNPPIEFLEAAVESVRAQIYDNWQLCIADDASTDPQVRATLEKYAQLDSRIEVVFRQRNGHISVTSNSAIQIARGTYVVMLDHDDLLTPHALFWMVEVLQRIPNARLIYSDEDKIDILGRRSNPYFKSDFNYDLLLSQNMVTHLVMYEKSLLNQLGGFRVGFEGAQDHDLVLRAVELITPMQVVHVPRVLYHWRMHSASTAQDITAKPYALNAATQAIQEHLDRVGSSARVEVLPHLSMFRVRYSLPETTPLVSIIIPTRNAHFLVQQCIDSIRCNSSYSSYEIILVDNGSDDPLALNYFARLALEDVRVLRDERRFNYAALNNLAVKQAHGEVLLLLNNDTEVINSDWLEEMVSHAVRPGVGAVGAKLLYPNGLVQHAGVVLGIGDCAGHVHKGQLQHAPGYFSRSALTQNFSAVTGACLAVMRSKYLEVGGLDETNLAVAFNDVDFCLRLGEIGYRNVWTPFAQLYHHESATRGYEDNPEKLARFETEVDYMQKRWGHLLFNDPYYNPNLSLEHEDWRVAYPPRVPLFPWA